MFTFGPARLCSIRAASRRKLQFPFRTGDLTMALWKAHGVPLRLLDSIRELGQSTLFIFCLHLDAVGE